MTWSSKRMWRLLTPTRGLPAAMLIVGVSVGTDSTSKVPGGFVGILSLPTEVLRPVGEVTRKTTRSPEQPATLRGPGRVLYAPGREPRATVPAATPAHAGTTPSSAELKRSTRLPKPCPKQLVSTSISRGTTET